MEEKIKEMEALAKQISEASTAYYVYDAPIMSDKQWDALYDKLVKLEAETGIILPNSPTQKVGGEALDSFVKVKHTARLYSLDKAQSFAEIEGWQERNQNIMPFETKYTVEYKFDGLPIAVKYENGNMVQALTRGNGEVGEDVTAQAKTIRSLPLTIECKDTIIVQGEVIMRLSVLDSLNNDSEDKLKNARNAAAGALKNLDPKITASRKLDFFAYHINYSEKLEFETQSEIHQFLIDQKFLVADFFEVVSSTSDIKAIIDKIATTKADLDYLIDGLVIKIDNRKVQAELGYTAKFPRGMLAYKFDAEETDTKLLDVVWQVGRTGKLTPVAILEPTELCGVTIRRATLNNYNDILRKKVKIGDMVFIRRSNEVIPEILSVAQTTQESIPINKPAVCPSCGSAVTETQANIYCPNHTNCPAQIIARIGHFASRNAMNIEGLSDKTILVLHQNFGITTFADLYSITREELLSLDGFKEKKADNILEGIKKSKNPTLASLIFALGIDGVGEKMAKTLAKKFKSIDALSVASIEELDSLPDIAEITATDIYEYFRDPFNMGQIEGLKSVGVEPVMGEIAQVESIFTGKKVVLTGGLSSLSRKDASEKIERLGGITSSSVSKSTDYVVVGTDAGSKLDKAISLGIKTLNEEEFLQILIEHGLN